MPSTFANARLIIFIALVSLGVVAASALADVIVPTSFANTEGNTNNCFPFNCVFTTEYQQLYAASTFSSDFLITGIAFRPDGNGGVFTSTFSNVLIQLGTTSVQPDVFDAVSIQPVERQFALRFHAVGYDDHDRRLTGCHPFVRRRDVAAVCRRF